MFDKPGSAQTIDPDAPRWTEAAHLGALHAFHVKELRTDVETEYGSKPAISADVTVLTDQGAVAGVFPDALIFGTVLISQLRESVGRAVLGRLEQGEKKPGKKPPWKLAEATEEETALAVRALTGAPAQQPAAKAAAAPAAGAPKAPWET